MSRVAEALRERAKFMDDQYTEQDLALADYIEALKAVHDDGYRSPVTDEWVQSAEAAALEALGVETE